eukprot:scaffold3526_cov72-Skeletonema_dohrnii-CCMP3373.AAC.2
MESNADGTHAAGGATEGGSTTHATMIPFISPTLTSTAASPQQEPPPLQLSQPAPAAPAAALPLQQLQISNKKAWDLVDTIKFPGGRSNVYNHIYEVNLKPNVDVNGLKDSKWLEKVRKGEHMVCMFCKKDGLPLERCLIKMKTGVTTNGNTHLNEKHATALKEDNEAKEEEIKRKTRGQKNGPAKKKTKTASMDLFAKSDQSFNQKKESHKARVREQADHLIHEFVNSGGHPDRTTQDPNFREVVDFIIKNAKDLENYEHMGSRKFVSIEDAKFSAFVDDVKSLVSEVRQWYLKETGKRSDRPEVSAEMILRLTLAKAYYTENEIFEVVDLTKEWPATTPFGDLPTVTMTTNAMNMNHPVMSDASIKLTSRLLESYEEYFSEPNPDRLAAMAVHPFLSGVGFEELQILREDDGETLVEQAKDILLKAMMKTAETTMNDVPITTAATADETENTATGDEELESSSRLALLRKHRQEKKKKKKSSSNSVQTKEERMKKVLDDYFDDELDPEEELKKQCKRVGKDTKKIDWAKVGKGDLLYISSEFDSLEWWKTQGSKKYPEVFAAALPILALPASNAFMERTFSACTWHDDPLRQSLREERYEKKVVVAVNADFRKKRKREN